MRATTMRWSVAFTKMTRRDENELERRITELVPAPPWADLVPRLRCAGIDTPSAVGLCAEVGDFDRFARRRAT